MKNILTGLVVGVIFGFGLAASGMTSTDKVLGFLDVFGAWQADLMFVMGGALIVTLVAFQWRKGWSKPFFDSQFHLPTNTAIDQPLLIGAVFFGVGWGFYGYCPGPALASLAYLKVDSVVFVLSMLIGMFVANKVGSVLK